MIPCSIHRSQADSESRHSNSPSPCSTLPEMDKTIQPAIECLRSKKQYSQAAPMIRRIREPARTVRQLELIQAARRTQRRISAAVPPPPQISSRSRNTSNSQAQTQPRRQSPHRRRCSEPVRKLRRRQPLMMLRRTRIHHISVQNQARRRLRQRSPGHCLRERNRTCRSAAPTERAKLSQPPSHTVTANGYSGNAAPQWLQLAVNVGIRARPGIIYCQS